VPLGEVKKNERGFERIEFTDFYGKACSLQQSSLAVTEPPGTSAVWLGVDGVESRMHLNYGEVRALVEHLTAWLEDGSF
jgi:hypothetical protein